VCFTGHRIDRWEGSLFLFYYAAYLLFLVARATGANWAGAFSGAMLFFVVPLTVIALLTGVVRAVRSGNRSADA
jgi:cation:H+ antiporter